LDLAHHEYEELWVLLHMTREGAPFEGHEGVKTQAEGTKRGLVLALERWRVLVELEHL
jgi:hypothetical protein